MGQTGSVEHQGTRILKADQYKDRMRSMWNKRATIYDETDTFHKKLALHLLDFANVQEGQAILDVASGTSFSAIH